MNNKEIEKKLSKILSYFKTRIHLHHEEVHNMVNRNIDGHLVCHIVGHAIVLLLSGSTYAQRPI